MLEEVAARAPHLVLDDPDDIGFRENLSFRIPLAVPVAWEA